MIEALRRRGYSNSGIAEAVGCSQPMICDIRQEAKKPGRELGARLLALMCEEREPVRDRRFRAVVTDGPGAMGYEKRVNALEAHGYVLMPGDIDIAARTIAREAGGEMFEGQVAVGEVLINRVRKALEIAKYQGKAQTNDHTIAQACLRPWQFSCWNLNDPNRGKCMSLNGSSEWYQKAEKAFMQAWSTESDLTKGATSYHTVATPKGYETRWPPKWAASMTRTVIIGAHVFYR